MKESLLAWLGATGSWAWHVSLTLLVLLNAMAATVVFVTRDRSLVNRWTSRWLGANLGLITFGVCAPVVTGLVRLALNAIPGVGAVASTLPK
jgi:hypothetical protein